MTVFPLKYDGSNTLQDMTTANLERLTYYLQTAYAALDQAQQQLALRLTHRQLNEQTKHKELLTTASLKVIHLIRVLDPKLIHPIHTSKIVLYRVQ